MDAGAYSVIEAEFQPGLAQCAGFDGGLQVGPNTYTCTDFSEDCSGDIVGGESLSCNINNVVIDTTPPTATLTVNKQVFGCDNILPADPPFIAEMGCEEFENDSPAWLDCNNSIITNSIFCQSLPENIFDIEVLDDQNTQIQQFEGSELGTTIENLEPGTYTVNEIEGTSILNQLGENSGLEASCINAAGFTDGGGLFNSASATTYFICFEYEDEQGNDCRTITLAAGESRTCTVKNYIRDAFDR